MIALLAAGMLMASCTVTDGDTIRCGKERVRLLGIDAPDSPSNSRCRPFPKPGAICDRARASASKASLQGILKGSVQVDRVGRDRYGRTLAVVYRGKINLSCAQLQAAHATYRAEWDNGGRVRRDCPRAAR